MNSALSRHLFFYPVTLMKGEPISFLRSSYKNRQWVSKGDLERYQLFKFKEIMKHAVANSVFYRELYRSHDISVEDIRSLGDIKALPTISKDNLTQSLETMSTNDKTRIFSSTKTTGGSTGQPVKLYKDSIALARERCATARSYEWAGIALGDSQLRFWGVPHSKKARRTSRIADLVANRRRVSAFDLTEDSLARYYHECELFKPKYIYGDVSAIEQFARFLIENKLKPLSSVKSIITTAEILNSNARSTIQRAFSANVYNEYGCGEVGSIAHES